MFRMMKTLALGFGAAAVLLSAPLSWAGAPPGPAAIEGHQKSLEQQASGDHGQTHGEMDDRMTSCSEHCKNNAKQIDELAEKAQEAKRSGDKKEMTRALDQIATVLAEMKDETAICLMDERGGRQGMAPGGEHEAHAKAGVSHEGASSPEKLPRK
jgi:hypothetical protein